MVDRLLTVLGGGLLLAIMAAPAMAGIINPPPITVPEPATLSVLAVGLGGAYVARRFFGKK